MKILKLLTVMITVFSTFSFGCTSLLRSLPSSGSPSQQNNLVSLLPASDVVIKINSKRLMSNSIPEALSLFPELAAKYNEQVKEAAGKSGIDPQSIEEIVIGLTYKSEKAANVKQNDFVALMRGSFDSAALLKASKQSAKAPVREEIIEGKTVYIVDISSAYSNKQIAPNENSEQNSLPENPVANKFKIDQVAMVALDSNVVAYAAPTQIRSLLAGNKTSVNPVLSELLERDPDAAINVAMDSSFQQYFMSPKLGGTAADDVPQMRESLISLDFDNNGLVVSLAALAAQENDAKKLEDSFLKMQSTMKQMIGNASNEMNQALVRAVDNFKITRSASEVQFEAKIPKNDLEKIVKGYAALFAAAFAAGSSQSTKPANLPPLPKPRKSLSIKNPL